MKKELMILEPLITFSPNYANLFSVLPVTNNTIPWILSYFMPLFSHVVEFNGRNRQFVDFDFESHKNYSQIIQMCPFIECHTYNVNDFTSDPDLIIKKFKRFIDDGLYIYTFVNEKYIPQYLTSKDVIHPVFVYGYSDSSFLIADFFPPNFKYIHTETSYRQLKEGVMASTFNVSTTITGDYLKGIQLWSYSDSFIKSHFPDLKNTLCIVKKNIEQLLESHVYSGFNAYVQSFPKSVHLCSGPILYEEIMEYNLKGDYSQYKNLFILIEHAKILLLASKFCYENSVASKEVVNKFESLIPVFSTVLGLYLKASLVEKEKKDLLLIRTNKYLKNAIDRKYMLLNEFYNELQKYSC